MKAQNLIDMKKFGIFKLSLSAKASVANPMFISASAPYSIGDVNVTVAHDLLFDTEAEAELKIKQLPSPALYVIMPCYVNIHSVSGSASSSVTHKKEGYYTDNYNTYYMEADGKKHYR